MIPYKSVVECYKAVHAILERGGIPNIQSVSQEVLSSSDLPQDVGDPSQTEGTITSVLKRIVDYSMRKVWSLILEILA